MDDIVKELLRSGYKVKLNAIGLSRGGIAALLLSKKLGYIDSYHLETNLLLLDPLPGNASIVPAIDIFGFSLANQAMDVSLSKNLKYVESLYPYLEVGDDTGDSTDKFLARFHVPIRTAYPSFTEVREEVILGAHLRAFQDMEKNKDEEHLSYGTGVIPVIKKLSRTIIYKFLNRVSCLALDDLAEEMSGIAHAFERDKEKWSLKLQNIIAGIIPKSRYLHSLDHSKITVSNDAPLNDPDELCLKIRPERPYLKMDRTPLTTEDLLDLLDFIENTMSTLSKQGKKGALLARIRKYLEEDENLSEEQFSFILRDTIAITL